MRSWPLERKRHCWHRDHPLASLWKPDVTDIPLRHVQVIWDYDGNESDAPSLLVMGHPDDVGRDAYGTRDDPDYLSSWGACSADFNQASDDQRLLMLFQKFHELVTFESLAPKKVHEAFCVIPEYRAALKDKGLRAHIPADLMDPDERD